jgi:hypothetical protein
MAPDAAACGHPSRRRYAPPQVEVIGWALRSETQRFSPSHDDANYPTEVCARAAPARTKNSAATKLQSGPTPPWHQSRNGDKRPEPPGSGLAAVRQAKNLKSCEGGGVGEISRWSSRPRWSRPRWSRPRWSRRMPRRAIGGGTRDPSISRNHIGPAVRETNRACGGQRSHARPSALSYLVRGTTCI